MADSVEDSVCVLAGELRAIGHSGRIGSVEVARDGNGWHGNYRSLLELRLDAIVLRLAFDQVYAPAIIGDDDRYVIRLIEGRGGPSTRGGANRSSPF